MAINFDITLQLLSLQRDLKETETDRTSLEEKVGKLSREKRALEDQIAKDRPSTEIGKLIIKAEIIGFHCARWLLIGGALSLATPAVGGIISIVNATLGGGISLANPALLSSLLTKEIQLQYLSQVGLKARLIASDAKNTFKEVSKDEVSHPNLLKIIPLPNVTQKDIEITAKEVKEIFQKELPALFRALGNFWANDMRIS